MAHRLEVIEIRDTGLIDAEGPHAVVRELAFQPGCVGALGQPEAALPRAEAAQVGGGAGGQLEPPPGVGGQQRQQRVGGRGGPELDPVERPKGAHQIAPAALEGHLGRGVVGRRAPDLGSQGRFAATLEAPGVLGVDHGTDLAQEAQVALPRLSLHRLQLVTEHRCEPDRHRRTVQNLEQREIDAGHRLPEPLLAERPGAKTLHVGHVRVQDQRKRAPPARHAGIGEGAPPTRRGTSTQASSTSAPITSAGTAAISSEATVLKAACVAMTANNEPVRS